MSVMGAQSVDEKAPLLPQQAAATQKDRNTQPVAVVLADVAPRAWRGSLLNCCAGCDSHGWGSCLLGYFAPCIAFGYAASLVAQLMCLPDSFQHPLSSAMQAKHEARAQPLRSRSGHAVLPFVSGRKSCVHRNFTGSCACLRPSNA